MPKTKLAKRVKWIKKIQSYKNRDKRCTYHWTLSNVGYCWGYANWLDYMKGDDINPRREQRVKSYIEFCKNCEYWKEKP